MFRGVLLGIRARLLFLRSARGLSAGKLNGRRPRRLRRGHEEQLRARSRAQQENDEQNGATGLKYRTGSGFERESIAPIRRKAISTTARLTACAQGLDLSLITQANMRLLNDFVSAATTPAG